MPPRITFWVNGTRYTATVTRYPPEGREALEFYDIHNRALFLGKPVLDVWDDDEPLARGGVYK